MTMGTKTLALGLLLFSSRIFADEVLSGHVTQTGNESRSDEGVELIAQIKNYSINPGNVVLRRNNFPKNTVISDADKCSYIVTETRTKVVDGKEVVSTTNIKKYVNPPCVARVLNDGAEGFLLPGDRILSINGRNYEQLEREDNVRSTESLKLLNKGIFEPLRIRIQRGGEVLEGNVQWRFAKGLYWKLTTLDDQAASQVMDNDPKNKNSTYARWRRWEAADFSPNSPAAPKK